MKTCACVCKASLILEQLESRTKASSVNRPVAGPAEVEVFHPFFASSRRSAQLPGCALHHRSAAATHTLAHARACTLVAATQRRYASFSFFTAAGATDVDADADAVLVLDCAAWACACARACACA